MTHNSCQYGALAPNAFSTQSILTSITPIFANLVIQFVIHESPESSIDAGKRFVFSGLPRKARVGEIGGISALCVTTIGFGGVPDIDM